MVKKLIKFITIEEYIKLVNYVKGSTDKLKKVHALAIILGFEAGMRISEIIGLPKEVSRCCKAEILNPLIIDEDNKKKHLAMYCKSCGKKLTKKDRVRKKGEWQVPPLTPDRVDIQSHMIRIDQGKGQKDRVVPLPRSFNENSLKLLPLNTHISRRSLQRYVTKLGQDLLGKKISFHSLRHGFGSHLASKGRPLHEIQMLMGHSDLSTTGIYLHANPVKAVEGARDVF